MSGVRSLRIPAASFVFALLAGASVATAQVDSADDVCPGNPNPCNVTTIQNVVDGAVLDFGTRTVNLSQSGQFNFGPGSGSILCGNFSASTTNPAIDANGPAAGGGTQSGRVEILARRTCSAGVSTKHCVDLADCQLGTCSTRRCSLRPTKTCGSDTECQLGTCSPTTRRCTGSATFVRCSTNADCDYGTCPQQLTCSSQIGAGTNCSANTDCDFGTCTVGNASISMGGSIVGNSDSPASIVLRAADSVSISKLVNLASSSLDSDGGDLTADAAAGSLTLTAKVNAPGGGDSQGGTVELTAGVDVVVQDEIDVVGGDFDGGSVEIDADRDITLGRSLLANSSAGAGFGGDILLDAGRHLVINGVSASNKTTIETNGHTDIEFFAGDGGTQDLASGGNMTLNINTRLIGNGSQPDGYGSDVSLDAGGDVVMNGDLTAKALGGDGTGGFVDIVSEGKTTVGATATFDITGGDSGGGVLEFEAASNVDFAGFADVSGSNGGSGGQTFLDSGTTSTLSGTLFVGGENGGINEVDGCRVVLTATGNMDNNVLNGENRIVARESIRLLAGSQMTVGASGENILQYRTATKPPLLQGTISPAPTHIVDPTLIGCPVCGNAEIDQTESCDDGNTASGDGCSSDCQNENCIAQTVSPGYPSVPLCADNNACTTDVCNPSLGGGTCQHPAKDCSDDFACTVDSCNAADGVCVNTPNNAACNDGNVCTDDFCSAEDGCDTTNNTMSCSDNNTCTENDACAAGTCTGVPIVGCGVCGDGNVNPPEQCDDGDAIFTAGQYCGVDCVLIPCGKPSSGTAPGNPKASDAQYTLRGAVGQVPCHVRVCDVDSSTKVVASDALNILRKAVGQPVVLNCPLP